MIKCIMRWQIVKDIIIKKRKELGLTQQELANKLNISDKVVSKWETGRSIPDTTMLIDLAAALELTINDLLAENSSNKKALKEVSNDIVSIKYKNLYIIFMFLQLVAAILVSLGRIALDNIYYYGNSNYHTYKVLYSGLITIGVLIELGAIANYLVSRNNLVSKFPQSTHIDKKYINYIIFPTFIILIVVLIIFICLHGLSNIEQLISLGIFGAVFSIPFIIFYFWNKKR